MHVRVSGLSQSQSKCNRNSCRANDSDSTRICQNFIQDQPP